MDLLRKSMSVLSEHRKAYIGMNIVYYGLILFWMAVVSLAPGIQTGMMASTRQGIEDSFLGPLADLYKSGNVPLAAFWTFVVNFTLGSFGTITLPSIVIPFSGLLIAFWRATIWGIIFSPVTAESRSLFFPHILILVMEGQAYVLTMLAAWVQSKGLLWPETLGETSHSRGLAAGMRLTGRLYVLIGLVLAVSAVCEALEIPLFFRAAGS